MVIGKQDQVKALNCEHMYVKHTYCVIINKYIYIYVSMRSFYEYVQICKIIKWVTVNVAWASLSVIISDHKNHHNTLHVMCFYLQRSWLFTQYYGYDTTNKNAPCKNTCPKPNLKSPSKYILHTNVRTSFLLSHQATKKPPKKKQIIRALSQKYPHPAANGFYYRGAEDVKCHQLVKSNRKNHTVASETEDLAFFTMVGMVGLLGGFPHWSHGFFL